MPASSPGRAKKPPSAGKGSISERRRRKQPRYYAAFPVVVAALSENGYEHLQGQSQDLSEAGIGILVAAELAMGDVVSIGFNLSQVLFEVRAVVRHRRTCRYGLEFLSLTADQKAWLAEYVKQLPAAD